MVIGTVNIEARPVKMRIVVPEFSVFTTPAGARRSPPSITTVSISTAICAPIARTAASVALVSSESSALVTVLRPFASAARKKAR